MNIKIWDNKNKQWLKPFAIYFDQVNNIRLVQCYIQDIDLGREVLNFNPTDFEHIAITGDISMNTELLPKDDKSYCDEFVNGGKCFQCGKYFSEHK